MMQFGNSLGLITAHYYYYINHTLEYRHSFAYCCIMPYHIEAGFDRSTVDPSFSGCSNASPVVLSPMGTIMSPKPCSSSLEGRAISIELFFPHETCVCVCERERAGVSGAVPTFFSGVISGRLASKNKQQLSSSVFRALKTRENKKNVGSIRFTKPGGRFIKRRFFF